MAEDKKTIEIKLTEEGAQGIADRDPQGLQPADLTAGLNVPPAGQSAAAADDAARWARWFEGDPYHAYQDSAERWDRWNGRTGSPADSTDPFGIDTSGISTQEINETIAQLEQEFQQLSQASQAAARAGMAASQGAGSLAGAAGQAAAALGGGGAGGAGGGAAGAGGAAGGFLGGAGGFAAGAVGAGAIVVGSLAAAATVTAGALLAIVATAGLFNQTVNELVEMVGGYSAEVAIASSESRIREIEDRLRLAQEAGPTIADLERVRSDVAHEMREMTKQLILVFGPLGVTLGKILTETMKAGNILLGWFSGAESTADKHIKLLQQLQIAMEQGQLMDIVNILKRIEELLHPEIALQKRIDDLFDPKNIGVLPVDFDADGDDDLGDPNFGF